MRFFGWLVRLERAPKSTSGAGNLAPTDESSPRLGGDGDFELEVVGESHYQDALEAVAGGRSEDGADSIVEARLIPEDNNPHDPMAVRIEVRGRTVGHLSREEARRFRSDFAALVSQGEPITCQGHVRGGWDRGAGDRGHFGIWLDVRESDEEASLQPASPSRSGTFEFLATLHVTTPLSVLLHHGETFTGRLEDAPRYGAPHEGDWSEQFSGAAGDLPSINRSEWELPSDAGAVRPSQYLPFLRDFRAIVEQPTSVREKLAALGQLPHKSPDYSSLWKRLELFYPDFPKSYFYRQLTTLPGIGDTLAKRLFEAGFTTPEELRLAPAASLRVVKGVGPKVLAKLQVHFLES